MVKNQQHIKYESEKVEILITTKCRVHKIKIPYRHCDTKCISSQN